MEDKQEAGYTGDFLRTENNWKYWADWNQLHALGIGVQQTVTKHFPVLLFLLVSSALGSLVKLIFNIMAEAFTGVVKD